MYQVHSLLEERQHLMPYTIVIDATVQDALELMATHHISSLPVMDRDRLAGIVSERDYVRKLAPKRVAPWDTGVREIMTTEVLSITPETPIEDCMALMSKNHIRHLPVLEEGSLVAMVSVSDIVTALCSARFSITERG